MARKKQTPIQKIKKKLEEAEDVLLKVKYNTDKNIGKDKLDELIIEVENTNDILSPIVEAKEIIKKMFSGPLDVAKKEEVDGIIGKIVKLRGK
jgi:hypothetical protein